MEEVRDNGGVAFVFQRPDRARNGGFIVPETYHPGFVVCIETAYTWRYRLNLVPTRQTPVLLYGSGLF